MVRILPRTLLRLDIAADAETAARLNRNEDLPEGGEVWHRFFTEADKARATDPEFATGDGAPRVQRAGPGRRELSRDRAACRAAAPASRSTPAAMC